MNRLFLKILPIFMFVLSILTFLLIAYAFIQAKSVIETFITAFFMLVSAFIAAVSFSILLKSKGD